MIYLPHRATSSLSWRRVEPKLGYRSRKRGRFTDPDPLRPLANTGTISAVVDSRLSQPGVI